MGIRVKKKASVRMVNENGENLYPVKEKKDQIEAGTPTVMILMVALVSHKGA